MGLMYGIIILLALVVGVLVGKISVDKSKNTNKVKELTDNYSKLLSQKKSSEVRLGQISENLAPLLKNFKYNPKEAHFIGMPIDYIIFEEDKVVFLEVKSGGSRLSSKQSNIKRLIKEGKIFWDEMRIN